MMGGGSICVGFDDRHLLKSLNLGTCITCNICQKKFSTNADLKRHLLRHEGVKPCSQCTRSQC